MTSLEEIHQDKPGLSEVLFVKTKENCPERKDFSGENLDVTGISDEVTSTDHIQLTNRNEFFLEALFYLEDKLIEQFDLDIFSDETEGCEQTLINLGYVIKRLKQAGGTIQSEINHLQCEIDRLKVRKDLFEGQAEFAAKRLSKALQLRGKIRIETPLVSIKLSSELLEVD